MTRTARIGASDMACRFCLRICTVVATLTTASSLRMINTRVRHVPISIWFMARATDIGCIDMIRTFATRIGAIVTAETISDIYLTVLKLCRFPCGRLVTYLAWAIGLNMPRALASGPGPIMATSATRTNTIMRKFRAFKCRCCMASAAVTRGNRVVI